MADKAWRSRIVGYGTEAADQLLANPKNWRIHPKAQQDALAGVLDEVGWVQNILVNKRTGYVIDGHARVGLAISRGETEVPVTYVDLSEEEEALVLATLDPLAAMAATDKDKQRDLMAEVAATSEKWAEMAAGMGLGGGAKPGLTDPDEVPAPPDDPVTKRGDLWLLGEHRLLCGDSTSAEDVTRLLAGAKPMMMVTDPPYGVEYDASWRAKVEGHTLNLNKQKLGKVMNDDRADWREAWALFPGSIAYVWHAGLHASEVEDSIRSCGFSIRAQIIWAKDRFALSRGDYHWQHEPCWYAIRHGDKGHTNGDRSQSTLWTIPAREDAGHGHSTQKPVECMERPIRNHDAAEIYEPFSGSGTTLIAAERLGRRCYAMELEPRYVDVAVRRWEEFTGKKATLG